VNDSLSFQKELLGLKSGKGQSSTIDSKDNTGRLSQLGQKRRLDHTNIRSRPVHSVTSSAMASSEGGTSMPRARAIFRFLTNSNLVMAVTM
jgi:hypothetical protein